MARRAGGLASADVVAAAARLGISEYEVFRRAYRQRHGCERRAAVEAAFDHYLWNDEVPDWVCRFVRQLVQLADQGFLDRPTRSPERRLLQGLLCCLLLGAVTGLVIILAIGAQQRLALTCFLPPCY